jgi:hypothetical protein
MLCIESLELLNKIKNEGILSELFLINDVGRVKWLHSYVHVNQQKIIWRLLYTRIFLELRTQQLIYGFTLAHLIICLKNFTHLEAFFIFFDSVQPKEKEEENKIVFSYSSNALVSYTSQYLRLLFRIETYKNRKFTKNIFSFVGKIRDIT